MDRWIDTDTIDRCYRSILLVVLTTDSIDPSVKDIFFLIDSIDHRSQNPYKTDDRRSISSLLTDGIDPSVRNRFSYHHFSE
jgi:regulator of RNase E activity RraB